MFKIKGDCPVPCDQQPINEYLLLKKSFLFSWSLSSKKSFISGMLFLFIGLYISFGIIIHIFTITTSLVKCLLLDLLLSDLFIFLVSIRLYLGWSYILKRLMSATIFYEESGWYDGQIWVKTSNYLIQDRLIGTYQVMPFIARVKYILIILIINLLINYLLINLF
uniref:Ycf36 n=1 Tax=Pleurostichidium falkenbergii TaxID=121064 RepID=A0A4D6UXT8_9FLOR|nr:hypothetical protein [Pleurostichidium falkenbergii]QCH39676.1 hypothetical protein [Pleurostichidium falkenbergii]